MRFTKPKKVIGLDIGTHAVKAVQMSRSGNTLSVEDVGYALVDPNQLNTDPIAAQADALREAIQRLAVNQSMLVGALPGQTVVIRYPRLKDIPIEDIDQAVETEASQNIPYDLSEVFLDWSLLDEETDGPEKLLKVLLVAAKNEVIDSRVQIADAAEIGYTMLSVDSLALVDAAEGCKMFNDDESVALVNIGASSVSIHFALNGISNFIRDISWGAKELIQALSKARRCDFEEAEAILFNYERELAKERKTTVAEAAPEGPPPLIAESMLDEDPVPQLDAPLGDETGPILLDPLDEDLGTLGESEATPLHAELDSFENEASFTDVLSMPIARLVTELRRSFDYYEHQLYERPVERIILSGGIAHLPLIREALENDLGVENVDVADPRQSALHIKAKLGAPEFEQYPAQFMVAIGLAARGTAEL